ncbi:MAG: 1-acyl-sn-glycerol-3-phosphate acyltransferase [Hyphomicrobiaceae bacterium]|nr:1-acyl-sn-glycerol-3-phosphate acyltransferase [Hyphomicrobiaceae bacterium]
MPRKPGLFDIDHTPLPRSPARAVVRGVAFVALTLPLMPVQWMLLRTSRKLSRKLPNWYHRRVCQIAGVRLKIIGEVVRDRPVLIASNHVTWLDIMVLSAVAPVSFVAKKEVAGWPFAGTLARLQRTVFVDRERRTSVGGTAGEIADRLRQGDAIVLFAEGTTSDGNRVLPFRSSLFAVTKPTVRTTPAEPANGTSGTAATGPTKTAPLETARAENAGAENAGDSAHKPVVEPVIEPVVQSLSIAYTRKNGIPMTWADRRAFGYLGDIGIGESAWSLLCEGSLEATITIGEPRPISEFTDRKSLAKHVEGEVRAGVIGALRG